MAGSRALLVGCAALSCIIGLSIRGIPVGLNEVVIWTGRFILLLAFLTIIISLVSPWITSVNVQKDICTVPQEEKERQQKLLREKQQEQLSKQVHSHVENVLKPREELKLRKKIETLGKSQLWTLSQGCRLGEAEESVNICSDSDDGTESANNEAVRKRKLPEQVTKPLPKNELPKPTKVITLPEEPVEGGNGVITIALRCPSGRVFKRRFYTSCSSLVLLDWMMKLGYHPVIYTICSTFPRCQLEFKSSSSLEDIGILKDIVLNVEEKTT
ncbi:UBX domain-containing protein 8 [Xenopus laevis]|uniref:UBX domain-containing protein 8 n=4 Tax=Xenopus laevis TaxID=8355 RepID=A3KNB8_XENLA|nr:UBX domain-containing protein 8 [Xenopus laevis]AAI33752.1 Unknown (protein for MGC:160997) [Xenopus laevis]OCU00398.1 hypothetical protein XELAEV_18006172mg [Xenopus laevis]